MTIPPPSEPRTFKLTDDCTFSGIRIHPNDREVDGGGYIEQGTRRLIPAHGFIPVPAVGSDPTEVAAPCETNLTDGERATRREMVRKIVRGPSNRS